MIGTLDNEEQARRFSDFLLVAEIDAHIEETTRGDWQVWVEHDDDLDEAKLQLEAFRSSPDDPKYTSIKTNASRLRKTEEVSAQRRRENYVDYRTSSAWSGLGQYGTPVIISLIAICIFVSLATQFGKDNSSRLYQALLFQSNPEITDKSITEEAWYINTRERGMFTDIREGQVWRLVTPTVIHYGLMHIFFNMMVFWRFGSIIESQKGSLKTILIILAIAIVSCASEAWWAQTMDDLRWNGFGGMSGVCGGLFGYAWMKHKYQPYERIHVADQEVWYTIAWFLLCSFGLMGGIANAAHWMGLATGVVIGITPRLVRVLKR